MKNTPKIIWILPAIVFVTAFLVHQPTPKAGAGEKIIHHIVSDLQFMKYDVYAGGFHVVSADLMVDLVKKNRYVLRLGAYTHGILAKLAPWKGVFQTKGWYDPKKSLPQPELHFSDTTWRDQKELTEFFYNKDGSFKDYRLHNEEKDGPQPVQPELSKNTTDILSATLKVMNNVAKTGECEGSDKIFDGARSYDLIFRPQKQVTLKATDLNVYAGPATECTVEVKPIAGKWHDKPRGWMSIQEQGREKGTMPTVWLAKMVENQPAVPVKIRVKTEYGTLFMHLTHYEGGGKKLDISK